MDKNRRRFDEKKEKNVAKDKRARRKDVDVEIVEGRKPVIYYFVRNSKRILYIIIFVIIAIIFFLFSLLASGWFKTALLVVGALFLIAALIIIIYQLLNPPLSDAAFDKSLQAEIEREHMNVLKKLNLNVEDTKLMKWQSIVTPAFLSKTFSSKMCKDGRLRYSKYSCTDFYFSKNMLFVSNFVYDFARGRIMRENLYEVFYKDISSLATKSIQHKFKNLMRQESESIVQVLSITLNGGEEIAIELGSYVIDNKYMGTYTVEMLNKINEIKTIVRERRLFTESNIE